MELLQQGAGSGGGPAPFLQKTYDMVEDAATNAIVSWGSKKNTFVVWDQVEFARGLLPTYFKHDNFSSFIRQLNTYGFRKVDQEKWEFSNEDFVRGEKQRLRNIRRRKPIHSHTQSSERASMEEEIDRLYKERDRLGDDLTRFGNPELWSGSQLQETERRVDGVTRRLEKLSNFVEKAVRDPSFVEHLAAVDFSAFSKKRRFLGKGDVVVVLENGSNGVPSRGSITPKLKLNHLFPQDFSNKLKLELCPAALDETRSSNGSRGCSPERAVVGAEAQEDPVVELLNTTVPLCQKRSNSLSWLSIDEEEEQNVSCQLKLALASSPLHLDEAETPDSKSYKSTTSSNVVKDASFHGGAKSGNGASIANTTNQGNVAATGRVNDKFWEQFLTERPGSLGNEEASSCSRSSAKDERITGGRETWMKTNDVGAMKL